MNKFLKNKSGFTLVEMVITAGLSGVIALVAYTNLQSSQKMINTSVVGSEITFLKNQTIVNMSIPDTCQKNFVTTPQQNIGTVATPTLYTSLVKKVGTTWVPFLETNKQYSETAKNVIKVTKISTYLSVTNTNAMVIKVEYEVRGTLTRASAKNIDFFTVEIFIGKDPADSTKIQNCFNDVAKMVRDAVQLACKPDASNPNSTVTYNPSVLPYGECVHDDIVLKDSSDVVVTKVCPVNQFLVKVDNSAGTVSGTTTTPGVVTYRCETFSLNPATPGCPAGQYLKGIDSTGTPECVAISTILDSLNINEAIATFGGGASPQVGGYKSINLDCPTNTVLQSIGAGGSKTCVPRVIAGNCPVANQYITQVNPDGSIVCTSYPKLATQCPAGQFIKQVNADGTIAACTALTLPANCANPNQVIQAIDVNGNATCVDNL